MPGFGVHTPGMPGGVGQQVVERRVLARLAGELGQHVADLGGQREAAFLDRLEDQDVGEGLGDREDREHVVVVERLLARRVLGPERFGEHHLAAAPDRQHRAEVVAARDVGENHLAQRVESLLPDCRHSRRSRREWSQWSHCPWAVRTVARGTQAADGRDMAERWQNKSYK